MYSRSPAPNPKSDLLNAIGAKYISSQTVPLRQLAAEVGAPNSKLETLNPELNPSSASFTPPQPPPALLARPSNQESPSAPHVPADRCPLSSAPAAAPGTLDLGLWTLDSRHLLHQLARLPPLVRRLTRWHQDSPNQPNQKHSRDRTQVEASLSHHATIMLPAPPCATRKFVCPNSSALFRQSVKTHVSSCLPSAFFAFSAVIIPPSLCFPEVQRLRANSHNSWAVLTHLTYLISGSVVITASKPGVRARPASTWKKSLAAVGLTRPVFEAASVELWVWMAERGVRRRAEVACGMRQAHGRIWP